MGDLVGLLSPMIDSAVSMHDVFVPLAWQLLALALVLALVFAVYEWWIAGPTGAAAKAVRAGLIFVIPLTLLSGTHWKDTMQDAAAFFGAGLTQPILAKHSGGTPTSGTDAISKTIEKLTSAMFASTKNNEESKMQYAENKEKSRGIVAGIIAGLTQALFELLLMLLAIGLSAALIFALFGPLLALNVGIIFGPLLIAWMPFGPTAHLARSWMTFMISQGLALVVGVAIAMIAAGTVGEVSDQMQRAATDSDTNVFVAMAVQAGGFAASAAVIIFVAFMLFRADDIAAAMVGGGGAGQSMVGAAMMNRIGRSTSSGGKPPLKPKPPK